jgi:hypothetical protein
LTELEKRGVDSIWDIVQVSVMNFDGLPFTSPLVVFSGPSGFIIKDYRIGIRIYFFYCELYIIGLWYGAPGVAGSHVHGKPRKFEPLDLDPVA